MLEFKEKYINPLTDFGFKKLFGTEPNKILLIDFLNQILPDKKIQDLTYASGEKQGLTELQDRIFKKLFEAAEIAKFSPVERDAYEESLKYYRDIKNVVDTSREEGMIEGRIEGREEGKIEGKIEVAKALKSDGFSIEVIMKSTGLTKEQIDQL